MVGAAGYEARNLTRLSEHQEVVALLLNLLESPGGRLIEHAKIVASILGHVGRARLKLNEAEAANVEVQAHLNSIYRLVHQLQTDPSAADDTATGELARPRETYPEWFDGINLSPKGRSYLRDRLEAGDSGASIAKQMGISAAAVSKYRKRWLLQSVRQGGAAE